MKRLVELENQQKSLNERLPMKDVFKQLQEARIAKAVAKAETARLAAAASITQTPTKAVSKALPYPTTAVASQMWQNVKPTSAHSRANDKKGRKKYESLNDSTVTDSSGQQWTMAGPVQEQQSPVILIICSENTCMKNTALQAFSNRVKEPNMIQKDYRNKRSVSTHSNFYIGEQIDTVSMQTAKSAVLGTVIMMKRKNVEEDERIFHRSANHLQLKMQV